MSIDSATKPTLPAPHRSHRQFDGLVHYYEHESSACRGPMRFTIYLPPAALRNDGRKFPTLYWLSGLTCTEETFMTEGGAAQAFAARHEIILVAPDTSPRATGTAGEDDDYDLGTGAGFYVDATTPKWSTHYRMETYVTEELRTIVDAHFPSDPARRGIFGHSMGGHGALILGLRHPDLYRSISAFAPICAPSLAPWGKKAFGEYFGPSPDTWMAHDASELVRDARRKTPIRIDQGLVDEFFATELFTDHFEKVARDSSYPVTIFRHADYDHSYYFISTFVGEHIAHHAAALSNIDLLRNDV